MLLRFGVAAPIIRLFCVLTALALSGCEPSGAHPGATDKVWGRVGTSKGRFNKPRAMTIDKNDQLYIVDMTARIQVFDADGNYLRSWQTPEHKNGRPTGLSFDRDGNLMVADTHYFRVLFYTPQGELLEDKTLGGECGPGPGQFNFVTDVVQDSAGNFYIAEYGEYDRIQKFSRDRQFLFQWGSHGSESGQFLRPQGLAISRQDQLWVADACNHRIQLFDATGNEPRLLKSWGTQGNEPGALSYPYNIVLDRDGNLYVAEFGNHRVQKFTPDGKSLGTWGCSGRRPGEMYQPWALVQDSKQRIHVLDTYNHRVQRFWF
jgi:DNA-binding beta-propeller fold protein YncE